MQIVNGVNEIVESIPKHVNNGIEMIMLIGIEIILIRILINTSFLFISLTCLKSHSFVISRKLLSDY